MAKRFGLCHTLIVALCVERGDTLRGRSLGLVAPGLGTNQEGQVLHPSLYGE